MKEIPMLFNSAMALAAWNGMKTHTMRPIKPGKLKVRPRFNVRNDFPFINGAMIAEAGKIYDCELNKSGAVSARIGTSLMGLKPGEIDFVTQFGGTTTLIKQDGKLFWQIAPIEKTVIWVRETYTIAGFYNGVADRPVKWLPDDFPLGYCEPGHRYGYIYRADGDIELSDPDGDNERKDGSSRSSWIPSIHMPRAATRIWLEVVGVRAERLQDISEADAAAEGVSECGGEIWNNYRNGFVCTWLECYGDGAWKMNPWVWAIEFRRVER